MTRGIHSTSHVRPSRAVTQAELDELYAAAYADEPFVTVVPTAPATKHVTGSNEVRLHIRLDERSGRIIAIGVEDNLVKGAAGQAVQAFNLVHGLPETAGLEQLPAGALTDMTTMPSERTIPDRSADLPAVERRAVIPAGFTAGGMAVGIKASGRPDLAVVLATDGPAAAAAVFTPNTFAAAPVRLSKAHLAATSGDARGGFGWARAIVSTSGSANAATGADGDADQLEVARLLSAATGVGIDHTLHLSTGRHRDAPAARQGRGGPWRAGAHPAGRRCRVRRGGRSPPHDRLGDEGRDHDRRAARGRRDARAP